MEQQPIEDQPDAVINFLNVSADELPDMEIDSDASSPVAPPTFSPLTSDSSQCSPSSNDSESDENTAQTNALIKTVKMPTFKIVGDNVDKSIRPRHETSDSHLQSIHYFHAYAVLDRCDMSSFEDAPSQFDATSADVCSVLPTMNDQSTMKQNLAVIVSHILRNNNFKFFKDNVRPIQRHIPHIYSKEMSLKSTVVSIMLLA